ncbi:MAG: cyclic nucleotide-binding domain-containing protein [Anderseniella sp.]
MLLNDEVELLGKVSLFCGLQPSQLKLLAFTSQRIKFEKGEMLFNQNDPGDSAYVVLSGEAEVIVDNKGVNLVVAKLGENSIIGEIAILCDVPRTAGVRAATDLETLCIEKEQMLKLLKEFPNMSIELMKVLAERLIATTADLSKVKAQLVALSDKK